MSIHPGPFFVSVADLLAQLGRRRDVSVGAPADWSIELSRLVADSGLSAELTLEGTSGGVFASGVIYTTVRHTCHRCLVEWEEEFELPFSEMIGGEGVEYPLVGDEIDLEIPFRDTVILALPLLPTCRSACQGLCAACGADLNSGACPGHDDEPDTPFAALRELLEP
ncbi:DUF177 domain-containing protein [bacterium]|nr:DUF177 domain-containing protein [bacterium]